MEKETWAAGAGEQTCVSDDSAQLPLTAENESNTDYQQLLDDNLGTLLELMTELKTEITDEWDRVKRGEATDKNLTKKIRSELPALIALTMQQESRLYDYNIQRSGKAGEYALDLGAARATIGERLARLRAVGGTEGVS